MSINKEQENSDVDLIGTNLEIRNRLSYKNKSEENKNVRSKNKELKETLVLFWKHSIQTQQSALTQELSRTKELSSYWVNLTLIVWIISLF